MEEEATDSGNSPMKETDMTDQSQSAREMVELADKLDAALKAHRAAEPAEMGRTHTALTCHLLGQTEQIIFALRLAAQAAPGEPVAWREALEEIVSWKHDTLGQRPKEPHPYDCPPEITEAFDRGARMAFYRCAERAARALAPPAALHGRDSCDD